MNISKHLHTWRKDALLVGLFALLTLGLALLPTGFEDRVQGESVRCRGLVLEVDNSEMADFGLVKTGDQKVTVEILDGPFEGEIMSGDNMLLGMMHLDKVFAPGDTALIVISMTPDGEVSFINPQDHYRLGWETFLLVLFALLLIAFGGWTGLKALLSFLFAALCIWKILVPYMLKGVDPLSLALGVTTLLCGAIIFLVAGPTRKGVVAFLGAFLGVLTSAVLAMIFTVELKLHGAVLPMSETLLYSGYAHLDLARIFMAAVFLAASGAVMDLGTDVAAAMEEVVEKKPDISRMEAIRSGFRVGRAVVGTMTTTLLLAYSGGYVTLLMAFMAQGIPMGTLFNFTFVSAEVVKTLVGSFGLVMVAPFTAVVGAFMFVPLRKP
ncbi:MAG: YibE/F family protein, partial [Desulfovibrio sp.]